MAIPHLLLLGTSVNRLSQRWYDTTICHFTHPIFLCHFPGEFLHQFYRLNTHRYHAPNQAYNIFFVIQVIGVAHNATTLILTHLVLVDYPVQGGTVTQPVLEAFLWYPC